MWVLEPTEAKKWEQGLLQAWNFNQPEALRAFELAAEQDSTAAMVYWGQAYALGPGANRYAEDLNGLPSFVRLGAVVQNTEVEAQTTSGEWFGC